MTINKEWIDWINLNISRGCDKEGIYKILIDEGFDPSDIEKQMGYQPMVDIDDIPIYTSVGFKKEGIFRQFYRDGEGSYHDALIYSILRSEYYQLKKDKLHKKDNIIHPNYL